MQETWVWSLGWEESLEKGKANSGYSEFWVANSCTRLSNFHFTSSVCSFISFLKISGIFSWIIIKKFVLFSSLGFHFHRFLIFIYCNSLPIINICHFLLNSFCPSSFHYNLIFPLDFQILIICCINLLIHSSRTSIS